MLDVDGHELSQEDKELLQHPSVGGVILFTRNFRDLEQLQKLINSIRVVRKDRVLISVDHEGGRVQRFREGFTRIPAMHKIGKLYDENPSEAKRLATDIAWLMAVELRSLDLDFSFAPVVDIDYGKCSVIGDRSFHSNPEIVYELAFAFCQGMQEAGMASVAKHFPGHGAVKEDSHMEIPVDHRSFEQIMEKDIHPYRMLIRDSLTAVMPAHVIYDQVDKNPAGFSEYWLKTILREQLQFNGVIFSDDLNMHGASVAGDSYADRAASALNAGCDMVLVCNNRPGAIEVVQSIKQHDPVSMSRLTRMHGRKPINRTKLHYMPRWKNVSKTCQQYIDEPNMELNL